MPDLLDHIDTQILTILQKDGRAKRNTIAEAVGLSLPSVSDRMRKLEERGFIMGYHAMVDAHRLGFDVTAFIRVDIAGSEHYAAFIEHVNSVDEIQEVHSITGEGSHLLKIRVRNTRELERLLAGVQRIPGVRGTRTSIVLSSIKESSALPLDTPSE